MTFFNNLSIRSKIILAFSTILTLVAILGLVAAHTLQTMTDSTQELQSSLFALQPLKQMGVDAEAMVQFAAETHVMADPDQIKDIPNSAAQRQQIIAEETATEKDFATQWSAYQPTMDSGRETTDGQAIIRAFQDISDFIGQENLADQGSDNSIGAKLLLVSIQQRLDTLRAAALDDETYNQSIVRAQNTKALANASFGKTLCMAMFGVIVLGTVLLGTLLVSGIATPIVAITAIMRRLASQDFSVQIPFIARKDEVGAMAHAVQVFKDSGQERKKLEAEALEFQKNLDQQLREMKAVNEAASADQKTVVDDLGKALAEVARGNLTVRLSDGIGSTYDRLKLDFNKAFESLCQTMISITTNTQSVRSGSSEINRASDDLSRRTEQQAASLEQTAAALDQITSTVKKAAESAKEARSVVLAAKVEAEHSGTVVSDTVNAMTGIEASSNQISNIIGVIDEIAFQTNLLALNAGVEAARAGEAGRGFAVVATEVRALAQRSADAAKEIKGLISASRDQVERGVKSVGEAGKALDRIAEQVGRLNILVGEIASSSQDQATGLAEVNTAINQMDQVTQQNAAMVEESTAASHSLAGDAEVLAALIAQFQVGQGSQTHTPYVPTKRAVQPSRSGSPPGKIKTVALAAKPSSVQVEKNGVDASSWSEF